MLRGRHTSPAPCSFEFADSSSDVIEAGGSVFLVRSRVFVVVVVVNPRSFGHGSSEEKWRDAAEMEAGSRDQQSHVCDATRVEHVYTRPDRNNTIARTVCSLEVQLFAL